MDPDNNEPQEDNKILAGLEALDESDKNDSVENKDAPVKDEKSEDKSSKVSDNEAKLLKELMKHKQAAKEAAAKVKDYESQLSGIDLEAAKEAIRLREEAEKAELEKRGEYERLLAKQNEAHAKAMKEMQDKIKASEEATTNLLKEIDSLTLNSAFSNSKFITEKLTLTPNKTRALYGDHFEVKDGKIVAYDKPKNASDRTPLINTAGDPLTFDEAMEEIINSDPEKDHLIKSVQKPGAASKSTTVETKSPAFEDSFDKIRAGIEALSKKR